MTEDEWLTTDDADRLMSWCFDHMSCRKLLLYACACCHALSHRFQDARSWKVVLAVEDYVEEEELPDSFYSVTLGAGEALRRCDSLPKEYARAAGSASFAAYILATAIVGCGELSRVDKRGAANAISHLRRGTKRSRTHQSRLLREIVGNLFRPVSIGQAWASSTVLGLAEGIYADRAFDRMPILADALEEAGCDNADILSHCRGDGPHVRGCWVVDLVLGKS